MLVNLWVRPSKECGRYRYRPRLRASVVSNFRRISKSISRKVVARVALCEESELSATRLMGGVAHPRAIRSPHEHLCHTRYARTPGICRLITQAPGDGTIGIQEGESTFDCEINKYMVVLKATKSRGHGTTCAE